MFHYWGAKAIVARLGYKTPSALADLKIRHGLPCYLRADPRNSFRKIYYASEQMILAWQLAKAKLDTDRLIAKREEKEQTK